jgi:hypothetical protein
LEPVVTQNDSEDTHVVATRPSESPTAQPSLRFENPLPPGADRDDLLERAEAAMDESRRLQLARRKVSRGDERRD